jgi:peptide deformylase
MMARGSAQRSAKRPVSRLVPRPLSLRLYPDSILRRVCVPVERFEGWLSDVLEEMLALMRTHEGIGLAAPQVGIVCRLFVARIEEQSICLANPVITTQSGKDEMAEGCLSLPGIRIDIERHRQIEVRGYDSRGRKRRHRVEGLWARVIQHEIDHLDGVLICDYRRQHGALEQ